MIGALAGVLTWVALALQTRVVALRCAGLCAFLVVVALVLPALARADVASPALVGISALAVLAAVDALTELVYDASVIALYACVLGARVWTGQLQHLLADAAAGIGIAAVFLLAAHFDQVTRPVASAGSVTAARIGAGDLLVLPVVPLAFGALPALYVTLLAMVPALVARALRGRQVPLLPFLLAGALAFVCLAPHFAPALEGTL